MRDNILKDVYANDKVELSSIEVKLGSVDEINTASQLVQKQYDFLDGSWIRLQSAKKKRYNTS